MNRDTVIRLDTCLTRPIITHMHAANNTSMEQSEDRLDAWAKGRGAAERFAQCAAPDGVAA